MVGGMRNLSATQEWNCDHPTALDPLVSAALRAFLPTHFSTALNTTNTSSSSNPASGEEVGFEVEYEWVGIMGFTPDRCPLIGPIDTSTDPTHTPTAPISDSGRGSSSSREYILAGYTGHGMPIAFLAGRDIADMISRSTGIDTATAIATATVDRGSGSGRDSGGTPACVLEAFHPSRFNHLPPPSTTTTSS
jgi:gamma-glutamylputrescine oxidase